MAGNKLSPSVTKLIDTYERQPMTIDDFIKGMTPGQMRLRPSPRDAMKAGRWSTIELLCHLSDCEQVYADRIKRTIAMDLPLVLAFKESDYVDRLACQKRDAQEEIEMIWVTRSQVARILRALPAQAWRRQAVHNHAGLKTLRDFVDTMVTHHDYHMAFVTRKRKLLGI